MKKKYAFIPGILLLTLLISLFFIPAEAINLNITEPETVSPFPDEVALVFTNSCVGCHGEGGKTMAMSAVNFSVWNDYSPAKQAAKAEKICKEVSSGAMPPKSFQKANPDLVPTEEQKLSICDWNSLLQEK